MSSVDLAQYGVSLAKDWVSVECGTMCSLTNILFLIDSFFFSHVSYSSTVYFRDWIGP